MKFKAPGGMMLDLDDTIIANEVFKEKIWDTIRSEFSYLDNINDVISSFNKMSDWFWSDPERHKKWRQDLKVARRHILRLVFTGNDFTDNGASTKIADRFTELLDFYMKPFPGAVEAIRFLKEKGIKLSIVTNGSSSSQREKIRRFGLTDLFDYIYIEGEHEFGKPDLRAYKFTLDQLGLQPSEAWMIGDKFEWEIEAPAQLGIKGVWINSRRELVKGFTVRPFLTLASLSEIVDVIE